MKCFEECYQTLNNNIDDAVSFYKVKSKKILHLFLKQKNLPQKNQQKILNFWSESKNKFYVGNEYITTTIKLTCLQVI